ncbi:hypothetical protein BCM02_101188 [Paenibacillus methanolicus]|uniref:Uncharacterized protein n=1 Tax=Paenibacillus methanolicus TaxID=582686 RepID=A0A5S5CH82_9BACL|nr:hypothetical protein BCM02_101188 [Paenibacillus methanolicus]
MDVEAYGIAILTVPGGVWQTRNENRVQAAVL